jgi:preprotein translocase subunit SecD
VLRLPTGNLPADECLIQLTLDAEGLARLQTVTAAHPQGQSGVFLFDELIAVIPCVTPIPTPLNISGNFSLARAQSLEYHLLKDHGPPRIAPPPNAKR